MTTEPSRPVHAGPAVIPGAVEWRLTIDGLAANPAEFSRDQLLAMAQMPGDASAVSCPYGSNLAGAVFEGVPLSHLVSLASPTAAARYVTVHAGPYAVSFRLDSLDRRSALLALRRNGALIEPAEGGPGRLVVGAGACFDTVKWVHHISLDADGSAATAADIVQRRHQPDAPLEPA